MDKSWMKVRDRTQPKYLDGVRNFLQFAFMSKKFGDEIKCPCIKCLNLTNGRKSKVYRHLVMYGIIESYTNWIYHGEILDGMQDESTSDVDEDDLDVEDDLDGMFEEAGVWEENFENSEFDSETDNFFKVLSEAKKDLYSGCKFSLLSFILRLLRLKTTYRWSNKSFSVLLEVLKVALPENNILPNSYREAWNIVKGLGHDYKKIHACPNDCMLYWKENENEIQCKRCLLSRYKTGNGDENGSRKISAKVVRYFSLIPRLKRMFMCSETSSLMRWHAKDRIDDGVLRHPADSLAWKQFDQQHPTFAEDDRSVRLGLATDGFSPFKSMRVSHSIWPIILIPYNLPPGLCMRKDNFLMCLLIDGPKSPGKDIDVYLRLVVDELKELWVGVPTYDSITKQMFIMRAALFGTISDLPGYDMISGWNTKTELRCPACGVNTHSTWLKHSKKYCFRGHRKFLPENHKYRSDSCSFDGTIECRLKPTRVFGEDLISEMNGVTTEYGKELPLPPKKRRKLNNGNWKKRSVLYELPYWPYILIRHWFDVMHIEKNVCDYIMWTILCIKGKSKDGLNARMDLQKMGIRKALHPQSLGEGKAFLPHASFAMTKKDKDIFYTVLKNAKMPDDFASNISRSITKDGLNFSQLKSHDNHILMELLLPIAVRRCLPSNVSRVLIELGNNFKQLYSKVSRPSDFEALEDRIALTLCHLERILPPAFFSIMEHLPIHLAEEAQICGPVQYRSMFPIERYLYILKNYVRSRSHPEGSIAEGYLVDECINFCSRYLVDCESMDLKKRNHEGSDNISKGEGRVIGGTKVHCLKNATLIQAHRYVLGNSELLAPFREEHLEVLGRENRRVDAYERRKIHNATFHQWIKEKVKELEKSDRHGQLTDELRYLATGPDRWVKRYSGYVINGFRFHTKDRERGRKTQNSGVFLGAVTESYSSRKDKRPKSGVVDFYGVLKDIIELHYPNGLKYVLFKCDWADNKSGVKEDEFKFTLVNFNHLLYKHDRITDEPFILASQAQQVWYLQDPVELDWHVAIKTTPRDLIDMRSDEFGALSEIQSNGISVNCDEDGTWLREDAEGSVVETSGAQDLEINEHDKFGAVDAMDFEGNFNDSDDSGDYNYSDDDVPTTYADEPDFDQVMS